MNTNLLLIIDQANYAPTEIKSDIMATLISENCLNRQTRTATFFGENIVKLTRFLIGAKRIKDVYKDYFIKNPQVAENDFALLISTLLTREPLPLIQDFLYALYLSKWEFKSDDMKKYFDSIVKNTYNNNNEPPIKPE
jgi:hypothetical protein